MITLFLSCVQMLLEHDKQPKKITSFNLYVNVKNFVCRIGENADILLTLYDVKEGQFFRFGAHMVNGVVAVSSQN